MNNNFWNIGQGSINDLRDPKLIQVPQRLMFELHGGCNLLCWHCRGRSEVPLGGSDSSKELVDYVLHQVIPHIKYIRIGGNGIGENLLSKNFNYFLTNLDKSIVKKVHLVTNLTLLDEDKARLIVEKIDILEISMEGVGESYTKIRGYAWDKFLKNFELIAKAKRSNPRSDLKITISACTFLSNLGDLLGLFDLEGLEIGQINFLDFRSTEKSVDHECLRNDPAKTKKFIKIFEQRSRETKIPIWMEFKDKLSLLNRIKRTLLPGSLKTCRFAWDCISISSEGYLSVCCMMFRLDLLKSFDQEILSILNRESFQAFRKKVNSKAPNAVCLSCKYKNPRSNVLKLFRKDF